MTAPRLFLLPMLLALSAPLFGTVRFIAQSAGIFSGGSACNGQTAITPATWNSTSESPGDISYVCGTINASAGATVLTIGWSGASIAPIQLIFDMGAIIQAPYLNASGGIVVSGRSWVTIDGGGNGIIQNTLDGTSGQNCPGGACNVQSDSSPIVLTECTHCTVENLNIASVYVRASGDTNQYGTGITVNDGGISGASNILIANNTISNAYSGILWLYGTNESGIEIKGDTIGHANWGIALRAPEPLDTIAGITIHENNIHDSANWDDYPSPYNNRHNGVLIFGNVTGNAVSGCYVYNNFFYGSFGSGASPGLYLDNVSTGTFTCTAFNNVIAPSSTGSAGKGGLTAQNESSSGPVHLVAYNNTIAASAPSNGPAGIWVEGGSMATTLENNVVYGWSYDLSTQSGAAKPTSNNNVWYNGGAPLFNVNGAGYSTLAAWQSASGQDANSISANPNLNLSTWVPNSGSPVVGMGTNLFSICTGQPNPGIGALCFDKNGTPRPSTGNWDAGAYQYGSVVLETPGLDGFFCNPTSVSPSAGSTCTVELTPAAGNGGITINLSSFPSDVNISTSVTVPQGSTSTTFPVTAGSVVTPTPVTLTASLAGVNETFGLTVNPPPAALNGISVSPGTILSGQSGSGTIALTEAAPAGGAMVTLSSSNPSAASVPTSVTVPSGATSANFPVTTGSLNTATSVTLTASYAGGSATFGLTVNPIPAALSAVSVFPGTIGSGQSGTGTVNLTASAPAGGAVVTLSTSNTTAATVPASITVASGATSATFTVTAGIVNAPTSVTLTASYSGVNVTFVLTVNPLPAALSAVSVNPGTIVSGQSGTGSVTLSTLAGTGGAVVTLSSSNSSAASVPSSVTVPQGSTFATFAVSTGSISGSMPVTLTANYSGVTVTCGLTVTAQPDFSIGISAGPGNVAAGGNATYTVTVTGNNGFNGAVNFATTGLPSGVEGSFNPTTVTGSGSTTLTVVTSSGAAAGGVTISVTGTSGSLNHNTTAALTITSGSGGGPGAVSVTPSSGTGASLTFAFVFTDPNGAADIVDAQVDIASTFSVSGACYLYYARALNEVYLASDTGVWQGPLAMGSSGTLQNSQCILNVGASSASIAGNTLTLNLALNFFTGFAGAKNVYMEVQNATQDSGWSTMGTWTVSSNLQSATLPISLSVTPNTGGGSLQTFVFAYTDPAGAADITAAQMDISATLASSGACFVYYARSPNEIFLANDTGAWLGPIPLGVAGSLQNSQCTVDAGASSASASGDNLTVSLAVSFQPAYSGAKKIHTKVTGATVDTSWVQLGTWTPGASSPDYALSMAPATQTVADGSNTTYTVTVTPSNGFSGVVNLGVSGLPMGVTGAFNPTTVTGSGTSTLTVTASGGGVAGSDTATVTGTSGLLSHTTSAALVVTGTSGESLSSVSVTPSSGSGSAQTFVFAYADPVGATDITGAQMDISATLASSGACFVYYARSPNEIFLANDTGAWLGPIPLGLAGSLQNSQCTVDAGASSASAAGNNLTVNLVVSFAPAYSGTKNVYTKVTTTTVDGSWGQVGTWTPGALGPDYALSMAPGTRTVADGSNTTYTVTVTPSAGFSGVVSFGVSGLPIGVTGAFNPTSVTGSGTSTLTVTASGSGVAGTYTATVTGTSGLLRHTTNTALTVISGRSPSVVSVTPNSGSASSQTFVFAYTDPAGAADVTAAQMDISATLISTGACFVYYARSPNEIFLANDTGTWLGPIPLGVAGSLQNSQCTVNAGASSATAAGNNLTVGLAITFQPAYSGAKKVYTKVLNATHDSGWSLKGTWVLP